MFGRETRMLLRHYLEQGDEQERAGAPVGRQPRHDSPLDSRRAISIGISTTTPVQYGPRRPVPTKLDAYKAIIETRLAAYPAVVRGAAAGGDPRGGLCRQLHAAERVCPSGAAGAAAGAGRSASRRRRAGKRRSTSPDSRFRGACGTPCSSCSATRGCCGAGSTRARTCGR